MSITKFAPMEATAITPFDCHNCNGLGYLLIDHVRYKCSSCEGRGIITRIGTLPKIKAIRLKRKMIDISLVGIREEYKLNQASISRLRQRNRDIRKQIGVKLKERAKIE